MPWPVDLHREQRGQAPLTVHIHSSPSNRFLFGASTQQIPLSTPLLSSSFSTSTVGSFASYQFSDGNSESPFLSSCSANLPPFAPFPSRLSSTTPAFRPPLQLPHTASRMSADSQLARLVSPALEEVLRVRRKFYVRAGNPFGFAFMGRFAVGRGDMMGKR